MMKINIPQFDINVKKIDNKYLLTTFYGCWALLSEEEYEDFRLNRSDIFKSLEKRDLIVTKKNIENIREKIRSRYGYLCRPPDLHVVGITERCNYKCPYCHSDSGEDGRDMDKKTAIDVADFILSVPSINPTIEFQGGEPLLNYSVIRFFIRYMEERRGEKIISYRLVSNLSGMNKKIFRELSDYGVKLCTSLDGPKELHDRHRGPGSYDNVVRWIDFVKQNYNKISAIPTITSYSLPYAKEIVEEYLKRGISLVRMRPVIYSGRAISNWKEIGISVDDYFGFWKESLDYCIKLCKSGRWIMEGTALTILKRLLTDYSDNMCFRSPCGAGINQLAYDPEGKIYICDSARPYEEFVIGNINSSYNQIMRRTSHLRGIANITTLCDSCVWSPFCGTCMISSYGSDKSVVSIKPRDFYCNLNQKQIEHIIKRLDSPDRAILLKWLTRSLSYRRYIGIGI